jgi:hypothetical protein
MSKEYLGDGLYANIESGALKLTAENGIQATDTVYLEPEVYAALLRYVERASREGAEK